MSAVPLADLVEARLDEIVRRWSERAAAQLDERLPRTQLVNEVPSLLRSIAGSLRAGRVLPEAAQDGAEHGEQRERVGTELDQMLHEYTLLRRVILEVAEEAGTPVPPRVSALLGDVLTEALARSVSQFVLAREEALRESEARFRALAEAMPQMVWTADAAGRLDYLNPRWFAYTGGAADAPRRLLRVLVVDDNRDAAESLAELAAVLGHDARIAYDGPSAVAAALASPPDLVLCDIGLPAMDGYEVARALRSGGVRARLVALSGYARPEDVARAAEAGFDRHLAKPASPDELERLLS